jgi:hypothetical protein
MQRLLFLVKEEKDSMISHILQGNDNAKTIEILLENYKEWLEPEEIAEMSENTLDEVYDYLMFLMTKEVVKESDEEKYKIDVTHPIAKGFFLLEHQLVTENIKQLLKDIQGEHIMLGKIIDLDRCYNDGKHWTHKELEEGMLYIVKLKDSPWLLGSFVHYGPPYATKWHFSPTWGATGRQLSYGHHPKEDGWTHIQEVIEVESSEQQKENEK